MVPSRSMTKCAQVAGSSWSSESGTSAEKVAIAEAASALTV